MPPVEEREVHPSTRRGGDYRYSCFNKGPAKHGDLAKDGLIISTDKTPEDGVPACRGCESIKDIEYIEKQRELQKSEVRQVLQNAMRAG